MSCCCENTIKLGCFDVCEDLQTGVLTDEAGVHIIEIQFMSITIKKEVTLIVGDEYVLPKMYVNENSEIVFKVVKPSGDVTDCYSLTTKACIDVG